jgi:hypothetical protein
MQRLHYHSQANDGSHGSVTDPAAETIEVGRSVDTDAVSSRAAATAVGAPRAARHAEGTGERGRATLPTSTTASRSEAAQRFGQYELIREIGRGGMGIVHLARDLRLGRLVAIKLLARRDSYDNARLLAEARVTARCNHENIVVIHDVGEHDGQPYMVFEHVDGRTLRAWLDERARQHLDDGMAPIEPSVAVSLMIPVVRALAYAHDMGDRPPRSQARQYHVDRRGHDQGARFRDRDLGRRHGARRSEVSDSRRRRAGRAHWHAALYVARAARWPQSRSAQ